MRLRVYQNSALVLSIAGVLFSGYLSGTRLLTNSCAFSEPCPTFLGHPACYFGFAMFLSLFAVSLSAKLLNAGGKWPVYANLVISLGGTLFAGYFAIAEIRGWLVRGFSSYGLGVSTCVYGAIFFAAILVLSVTARARVIAR